MILGADLGVGRFVGGEVEVCAQAHTRVSEARESARSLQVKVESVVQ